MSSQRTLANRGNRSRLRLERLEEREMPAFAAVGSEFRVNVATAVQQDNVAIASDADGDFVVVWDSNDPGGFNVYMHRYSRDGTSLSGDMLVNSSNTVQHYTPAVAMDADGDYVVAWASGSGIDARRFSGTGVPVGPEFRVTPSPNYLSDISIGMDVFGNFVVTWMDNGTPDSVLARAYSADGQARGPEFDVGNGGECDVAMDANGDFVIAWRDPDYKVRAARYDRFGAEIGADFIVNTTTTGLHRFPSVGIDAAGNFIVAWVSAPDTITDGDILYRRFTSDGVPLTPTDSTLIGVAGINDRAPSIGHNARDRFIVGYQQEFASDFNIWYRTGNDAGTLDLDRIVNTNAVPEIRPPAATMDMHGNAVIVWPANPGFNFDIYGQRYAESEDLVGPWITGVTMGGSEILEAERIQTAATSIRVAFSENMSVTGGSTGGNSVTNPSNWRLTRNGTVLNSITSITYGFDSATRKFIAMLNLKNPLTPGEYTVGTFQSASFTGMRDLATNRVDGDYNGVPGTDFVRSFRVGHPLVVGLESPVSSSTIGIQQDPRIGFDAAGNSVVVWRSNEVGPNDFDIYARRFANTGAPIGNAFRVNSFVTGVQSEPAVAVAADGQFVVTWTSAGQDPDGSSGIYAKRFNAAGTSITSEFGVNSFTTGAQRSPSIAISATGEFVAAWESFNQDGSVEGVYARRFLAVGGAGFPEFRVNTVTANAQRQPSVAMDPSGNFVVAFTGQDGNGSGIFLRRFAANGMPIDAADVPVNSVTGGHQEAPAVAIDRDGDFVVTWQSADPTTELSFDIRAKYYTAAGVASGGSFPINEVRIGEQLRPRVALDADGDFVITWEGNHTGQYDIYGLRFDPAGNSATTEFQVNTVTSGVQSNAAVAMTPEGDFTVVWTNGGSALPSPAMRRFAVVAPTVASVQVHDGSQQRSRVTSLTVTFNTQVTFAGAVASAFTMTRNGGGAVGYTATANVVNGITVVTLSNFTGGETQFASLRDGRFTLTVVANQVSANALQMAGNFTFGDAQGLFRMYGDINGDRQVDGFDFGAFSSTYGLGSASPNFVAAFDVNGDGVIDGFDFGQFSGRVFTVLP